MKAQYTIPAILRYPVRVGAVTAAPSVPLKNPVTHSPLRPRGPAVSKVSAYRPATGGKFNERLLLAMRWMVRTRVSIACSNRGSNSILWSSSANSASDAWNRNYNSDNANVNRNSNTRSNGNSIRCIRDFYERQKAGFSMFF